MQFFFIPFRATQHIYRQGNEGCNNANSPDKLFPEYPFCQNTKCKKAKQGSIGDSRKFQYEINNELIINGFKNKYQDKENQGEGKVNFQTCTSFFFFRGITFFYSKYINTITGSKRRNSPVYARK